MKIYDVAIIGLGPAGATLARTVSPTASVVAFDKKGTGFEKPCGGLLAPDAQKILAQLNLVLPKSLLVDPQIFSVHTFDIDSGKNRHYRRFYLNLNRTAFDNWLIGLIPSHVALHLDAVVTELVKEKEVWRIEWRKAGQSYTTYAKAIVGADGANSIVRKAALPQHKIKSYVSVQQVFKDENQRPFYACVFDSDATDCYSWGLSKDGSFIFGGAYAANRCREAFERQKNVLAKQYNFTFGTPLVTQACMVLRPNRISQITTGKDNAFLVGEAGEFISSSSLEGISWAIRTGHILGEILCNSTTPMADYKRATLGLKLKLGMKMIKCIPLYNSLLRKLIIKSGIQSFEILN